MTNDPCVDVSDLAFACASLRQFAIADTHVGYDCAKEPAGIKIRPRDWRMFERRTLQQRDDALAFERQAYS
jgi:metallophosphoesterase superfamily enzyme